MTDLGDQKPIAEADLPEPLTPEQITQAKLLDLHGRVIALEHDNRLLLGLLAKLGDLHNTKLKQRQVDGGMVLYWELAGRIVVP